MHRRTQGIGDVGAEDLALLGVADSEHGHKTSQLVGAGEFYQPIGAVQVLEAIVGQRLLAIKAANCGIHDVGGLVAVLAALLKFRV